MLRSYFIIFSIFSASIAFGAVINITPETQSPPFDRLIVKGHDWISSVELIGPRDGKTIPYTIVYRFKNHTTVLPVHTVVTRTKKLTINLLKNNVISGKMAIDKNNIPKSINDYEGVVHLSQQVGGDLYLKIKNYLSLENTDIPSRVPSLALNLEGLSETQSLLFISSSKQRMLPSAAPFRTVHAGFPHTALQFVFQFST